MRVALLQITSGDDPGENLAAVRKRMAEAAADGAQFILTPEVTNCVSTSRSHQRAVLHHEADDPTLAALRAEAGIITVDLDMAEVAQARRRVPSLRHDRDFDGP